MIDIEAALAALSLDDKCALLAGKTTWRTRAFPDAGVPQLKMSDGPNGVRGEGFGSGGTPGVVVPAGITLGATWDPDLIEEVGSLLGNEAIRKRAHVLLGPTVNLHRTPVGGRTFECYSEDPELSGLLAVAYIRGVQSHDVAVTVKHFVCNDTEIDRMTVDVDVDERTLRELYLRPFELAIRRGGAWGVMSAYNQVDGDFCAENRRLLTDILRNEWGFDGMVVSDWFGVHHTVPAANAGLNVEMPGPARVYGRSLVAAVDRHDVDHAQVDRLVRDVLVVMNRVRADERTPDGPEESVDDDAERALTRRAAIAGTVLLRNAPIGATSHDPTAASTGPALEPAGDRVLPFDPATVSSIAMIGPNAAIDRSMGGGSASLTPFKRRTLLAAVTDRLGPGTATDARVVFEPGVRIDRLTPVVLRSQLVQPDGEPGLRVSYVNGREWDGPTVVTDVSSSSLIRFFGSTPDGVDSKGFSARIEGAFVPDRDGTHTIGVVTTGPTKVTVGSGAEARTIVDDPDMELPRSDEFFGYGSVEVAADIECTEGVPVPLSVMWSTTSGNGFAAIRLGVRSPEPADLMDRAVAAAADADIAIVVVGTNDEWETEGLDRTSMGLPGRQDELVRRVVAANPRTAVIVNAGSPVTLDWAADDDSSPAPAVLTSFFAGQEQAEALVDVLLGAADPGGRLPVSFPRRLQDHPAFVHHRPDHTTDGRSSQRYGEGLFIGYRWYDARDLPTRFPFGHGLSYGAVDWAAPTASTARVARDARGRVPDVTVSVDLRSVSDRSTTVVVQGYVAPVEPTWTTPVKQLRTWAKLVVPASATCTATLVFDHDAFHHWDTATDAWVVEPGEYDLVLAESAEVERFRVRLTIG